MRKIYLLPSLMMLLSFSGIAQSYQKTDLGLKTVINNVGVEIQFYSPSIVRVLKSPQGRTFTKESLSVTIKPQTIKLAFIQQGDVVSLKSDRLKVDVNLESGKISYSVSAGELLFSEKESGATFTDFNDAGVKTYTVSQSFLLDNDEAIYGLGIQQQGKMVQRNLKLNMVQGNTDDYIPFFQSVKGYGLFWDNYSLPSLWTIQQAPHSNRMLVIV
jgi:alpha-D-xyloside xylohydrolase